MPRIKVESINLRGKFRQVDQDRYLAMRRACLAALSKAELGLTLAESQERLMRASG